MRTRWKIFIGAFAALAVLLVLNAVVTDRETAPAEIVFDGAEIVELQAGGNLQVLDVAAGEPAAGGAEAPPIVLIHGYTAALDWWSEVQTELSRSHRVIAIDLLGHGGSAKPGSGYTITNQADLIAEALNELGVEGAVVVGHSLGGSVATALAEQASELVDRLVIVGMAPRVGGDFGHLNLMAWISRQPLIGQALHRLTPRALARMGLEQGFAPGFPVPDFTVDDLDRMTYTAYREWPTANEEFTEERPLNERVQEAFVPLLVIFGSEDQIFDARASISAFAAVPAAQTELLDGVGHSPMVEAPRETAELIEAFAAPPPAPEPRARERGQQGRGDARPGSRPGRTDPGPNRRPGRTEPQG